MLFNSYRFVFLFLPVAMAGFHLLGRFGRKPVIGWLSLCSLVFYAVWRPPFVLLLLGSILVNYLVSLAIARAPEGGASRKRLLWTGISLNLLALFYFKYLYKTLLLLFHLHAKGSAPIPILLPLGISFFTFTQISYLVDLAQGAGGAPGSAWLCAVCNLLPPPHRRPHPAPQRDDAPVRRRPTLPPRPRGRLHRDHVVSARARQEGADRRPALSRRRRRLRPRGHPDRNGRLGRAGDVHHAALLRLLRLLGHGDRPRPHLLHTLPAELRLALQSHQRHRVLAALAHDPDALRHALPLQPDAAGRATPPHRRRTEGLAQGARHAQRLPRPWPLTPPWPPWR